MLKGPSKTKKVQVSRPLLNFLDYYLSRLQVEPEASFVPDKPQQAQIHAAFIVGRDSEQKQRFEVTLSVRTYKVKQEENLPYVVDFAILGQFWSNLVLAAGGIPV